MLNRNVKPSNFAVGRTPQVSFNHDDDDQHLGHDDDDDGDDDEEDDGVNADADNDIFQTMRRIYMLDFGLARQYTNANGEVKYILIMIIITIIMIMIITITTMMMMIIITMIT